jgi:hypothetical protein
MDDKERITRVASPIVRESVPLISSETTFTSPVATPFSIFSTVSFAMMHPPKSGRKFVLNSVIPQDDISYLY